MKIIYRKGYPSKSSIQKLIDEYFVNIKGYFPFNYDCISWLGQINWQRSYMNEHIDGFVTFLNEKGAAVKSYDLYESPTTGNITFQKK